LPQEREPERSFRKKEDLFVHTIGLGYVSAENEFSGAGSVKCVTFLGSSNPEFAISSPS
jgi:hypothetical protein